MAGSLIKIDEEIVSSAVASVTLTGIDSTYDVYVVKLNNVFASADDDFKIRITKSEHHKQIVIMTEQVKI